MKLPGMRIACMLSPLLIVLAFVSRCWWVAVWRAVLRMLAVWKGTSAVGKILESLVSA